MGGENRIVVYGEAPRGETSAAVAQRAFEALIGASRELVSLLSMDLPYGVEIHVKDARQIDYDLRHVLTRGQELLELLEVSLPGFEGAEPYRPALVRGTWTRRVDRAIDSEARLGEVMNAIQDLHFLLRFDIENCEVAVELIGDLISELKAVLVHGSHMQDVLRDALVDKDDWTISDEWDEFQREKALRNAPLGALVIGPWKPGAPGRRRSQEEVSESELRVNKSCGAERR